MSRATCLLLASLSFAMPSLAAPPPAAETLVVKVGYTMFDSPGKPSGLEAVKWYLSETAKSSQQPPWKRPLQFELVLGNYYQIWSWFKTGQIDAAVVSPFMAMLLERDSQAISVLELSEGKNPAAHFPVVAATGTWKDDPVRGVNAYLQALLDAAGKSERSSEAVRADVQKIREKFRFDLVSHFSSSGFIMPSLYAQSWIDSRDRGDLDEDQKCRFWRLFFENAHLTLAHDETHAPPPVSTLKFSYEFSTQDQRPPTFGDWKTYPIGDSSLKGGPSIPNDVLLVRQKLAEDAIGIKGVDPERLSQQLMPAKIQSEFQKGNWKYRELHFFNPSVHNAFRERVSRLFSSEAGNAELVRLNDRWFEKGLFDFTIDETMSFLRQDQRDSRVSQLALVLSGGGVKSLYQTVILDHLYARQIRNFDADSKGDAGALTVHTMIGTSGGAMLAFFAAQHPQIASLKDIVWSTSAKRLFPETDLPRLFSLLGMLIVIQLVLLVVKVFNLGNYRAASAPLKKFCVPKVVVIGLLLVLLGAAAIVVTRGEAIETVPWFEAAFFVLTGIAVHFGITCISQAAVAPTPRHATLRKLAGIGLTFGAELLLIAGVARYLAVSAPEAFHGSSLPELSSLASAGVFLVAAALIALASTGRWGLAVEGAKDYVAALATAITILGVAFFPLILLAQIGRGSLLELTGPYWIRALAMALAAPLIVLYAARHMSRLQFLRRGLVELIRDRHGVLTTTLATTLIGVFAFCIVCWLVLVAPAVYSNVFAVKAFREALPPEKLWTNRFHSNLIVTGTLLRRQDCSLHDVKEDGLYFCFEGPEGCGADGGPWQVFRKPAPARAVDAVFASGSAFPVFPPHRVHLPNGCEVPLVDGGYAHNVPLDAASKADARQVLILNASPDPRDAVSQATPLWRRFLQQSRLEGGGLIRSSPDVLSFMFERAQELDRNIGESLVVASLSPRPEDGWWPFLLDFSPDVRNRMVAAAAQDIRQERRIGHILSWGRPVFLSRELTEPKENAAPAKPDSPQGLQQRNVHG